MRVTFLGDSHLQRTVEAASVALGCEPVDVLPDLVIVAEDIEGDVHRYVQDGLNIVSVVEPGRPLIIMSQVEPGFTRKLRKHYEHVYYQLDTLRIFDAMQRAICPERIIVGCADPTLDPPAVYEEYLGLFNCPIHWMSYESAEFAKLAINFYLAASCTAAKALYEASRECGASYQQTLTALTTDGRIGPKAYLSPVAYGGHLPRDVERIRNMIGGPFVEAVFDNRRRLENRPGTKGKTAKGWEESHSDNPSNGSAGDAVFQLGNTILAAKV